MPARVEDPPLVRGQGRFIANVTLPGMVHLHVVRSPHAHARIRGIDVSRARQAPGVVDVVTAGDLAGGGPPMPVATGVPGLVTPEHHVLCRDRVRLVGDPVAVVVAESAALAVDAAELVEVDYEPLPAVVDPFAALATGAPLVHDELGSNVVVDLPFGQLPPASPDEVVVHLQLVNQRVVAAAMEPRGVVADYRAGAGTLTLHLSTQAPHVMRTHLAEVLGLAETQVRVIAGDIGGAFGSKLNVYAEDVLAALLAMRLGRPVRWIETRSEAMVATSHARGLHAGIELRATRDGTITALGLDEVADFGAYLHPMTAIGALVTATMIDGCYRIPTLAVRIRGVLTNKTPLDPYRGFARAEASYFVERSVDALAAELGLDPVDVRRRNFLRPDELPRTSPLGHHVENGEFEQLLDRALDAGDYDGMRARQARMRADGRLVGIGIASYLWRAAYPSRLIELDNDFLPGGWETAVVRVERSGDVVVRLGVSPHGQGIATVIGSLVADRFGIDPSRVRVVTGDTDATPYGMGTAGSRSIATAAPAAAAAADEVIGKATELAAHHLEASVDDIVWDDGHAAVRGVPARRLSWRELARLSTTGTKRPAGMAPGLEATASFDPPEYNSPAGAHLVLVEVDRETGATSILRYVAVDDFGVVLNPTIVEGQVHGALAQGIGQALFEGIEYDEAGTLVTSSFVTYGVPGAPDLPSFELDRIEVPSLQNPLGVKGAGEAGTIGAPPAVVNAVLDALRPLGVRHLDMPLTPHTVWRAIQEVTS